MNEKTITDYDLQALTDNELNHNEIENVLKHIEQTPNARSRYKELVEQKDLLKLWWSNQRVT